MVILIMPDRHMGSLGHLFCLSRIACFRAPMLLYALIGSQTCMIGHTVAAETVSPGTDASTDSGGAGAVHIDGEPNSEITVIRKRAGEAEIASETEFTEADVASQGTYDIRELLSRLQPFIDPSGTPPLLLVNGRPVGFDRSILSYPPEALTKVAVLRPEAAARYGAPSAQRVVNLVLKRKFASLEGGGSVNFATAGGQLGEDLNFARFAIDGETRWNAKVRAGHQSALLKSSRGLQPSTDSANRINLVEGAHGDEINLILAKAAGEIVKTATNPLVAQSNLSPESSLAAANQRRTLDPNAYETLQPSSQNLAFSLGISHPIEDLSASLSIDATRNQSEGLNGLPTASLVLPSGSRWSPLAGTVVLQRTFPGARALRSLNDQRSLSTSLSIAGRALGLQTSMAIGLSFSKGTSLQETGVATETMQQLINDNDPSFNPFEVFNTEFLVGSRSKSSSVNANFSMNLQKNIFDLPTGAVGWSFSGTAGRASSRSSLNDLFSNVRIPTRSKNSQWSGQTSLSLPISRRNTDFAFLGDLSFDINIGYAGASGGQGQNSIGAGTTWRPVPKIQIAVSINRSSATPSVAQTDSLIITTTSRVFDYSRQEIADVIWIAGGNPARDRRQSRQRNINVLFTATPFDQQDLSLDFRYRHSKATGGSTEFPELTPTVELAFPERISRNDKGRLISVDARPIAIEHDISAELSSSLSFRSNAQDRRRSRGANDTYSPAPLQFNFAINHQYLLHDATTIRQGLPPINHIGGDSGVSRHTIDAQFGVGERAFGSNINLNWRSAYRVRAEEVKYRVEPPLRINFSAFIAPDRLFQELERFPIIQKMKISLNIANIFNSYKMIHDVQKGNSKVQSRNDVDPLGRTIMISLQKQI